MLVLAVGHGLNGTRNVIDDYVHDPARNQVAHTAVQLLGIVLIVVSASLLTVIFINLGI